MEKVKRPSISDKQVVDKLTERLVPSVIKWIEQENKMDDSEKQELASDLKRCFSRGYDGFTIAKELDRIGYEGDSSLVEILDDADSFAYEIHTEFVKEWVIANNITTDLKVGDTVQAQESFRKITGKITAIHESIAMCVVYSPELGHVKPGCGSGTLGTFCRFEETEKIDEH